MANEEVEALGAREAMALKLHSNNITCAAFWSEEDLVCTGSMDNTLMLWRVRDGWNHRLRAHCGWVTCCAFQPRGAMLASGSADETLRLWNLAVLLVAEDSGETNVNEREEAPKSNG